MGNKKSGLEGKLNSGKPQNEITKESNLMDLYQALRGEHRAAKRKDVVLHRAYCMLGYLYDERKPTIVPVQVHTVGELYSITGKDMLTFRGYGRKTWAKLNEHLPKYGLPPLKLPQEYTSGR